ncbi:hypothetical protein ACXPVS_27340, partial [Pseudomonas sp. Ma2-10]
MNTDHEGPTIISSLFNADFLGRPFMRQTVMIPWFYLEAHVRYGKEFVGEMLMVSSFEALKDILKVQHESFRGKPPAQPPVIPYLHSPRCALQKRSTHETTHHTH